MEFNNVEREVSRLERLINTSTSIDSYLANEFECSLLDLYDMLNVHRELYKTHLIQIESLLIKICS
jgi:hypothetical protein